jgi:hypothetical protein
MRNLTLLADRQYGLIDEPEGASIVSFTSSTSLDGGSIYALLDTGVLYAFQIQDVTLEFAQRWDLPAAVPSEDAPPPSDTNEWFDVSYVGMTGCIVCMSHAGLIMSIEDQEPDKIELVGVIDGGISSAMWSGDQNSLVIVTNNNSLMCMSSAWELLYEVPTTENRAPSSLSSLSWRSNSDAFALVATDVSDNTTFVRLYNREMELTAVGRFVEGDRIRTAVCANMVYYVTRFQAVYGVTFHLTALRCVEMHCTALRCVEMHCTALHCVGSRIALRRWIALHCVALKCITLR